MYQNGGHGHSHGPGGHSHGQGAHSHGPVTSPITSFDANPQVGAQMPVTEPLSLQSRLLDTVDAKLLGAAKLGQLDTLKELVEENGVDALFKAVDHERGCTLVHWAAINGHLNILDYLAQQVR